MQQLQCPLGYYWNGQMCLPFNVQVQSSKFISGLEYFIFDLCLSTTGLVTISVVITSLLIWLFRASLYAAYEYYRRPSQPKTVVDVSTKSINQWAAATAALLRGGPIPAYVPAADGSGASEAVDSPASPNGSKLPNRHI